MKLIQCQSKPNWDEYILENRGHPLQLWGWGDVKSAHGWQAQRMFMYDDDEKVVGAVQVLIRRLPWPMRSIAYVPRGPVVDESNRSDLLDFLAKYVKRVYHSVALTIEPDCVEYTLPKGWRKAKNRILPEKTIILDLNKSESGLLEDMPRKKRYYVRKAASEKHEIRTVKTREELGKCLVIYHETSKRAGFALHNDQYYYDIFINLGDHSQVWAVYLDGQIIAFSWLIISAETALELYGGMNEKARSIDIGYALKWHTIRECKKWGIRRYDFGGLIDGGVSSFKKGWSKQETQMAGTFDRPLSAIYGTYSSTLPMAKSAAQKTKKIFKR